MINDRSFGFSVLAVVYEMSDLHVIGIAPDHPMQK